VTADSSLDFQAPYLLKLLSSAPLSDNISYYFYMIFAEKGANTEVIVEDAWFSYDDLFNSGVGLQLGQFQVSDLMFPREIRLTFQDFMAYRFAGITYDRGVLFGRGFGPLDMSLGLVNGNGIEQNFNVTSPGYRRPDHLFDNDTGKSIFGRSACSAYSASNVTRPARPARRRATATRTRRFLVSTLQGALQTGGTGSGRFSGTVGTGSWTPRPTTSGQPALRASTTYTATGGCFPR
jgi:hypothetical protein